MSNHYYNSFRYRVCGYASDNLIFTKYCKTKDEAVEYFNRCCGTNSYNYWYEIWDDDISALLFSTED